VLPALASAEIDDGVGYASGMGAWLPTIDIAVRAEHAAFLGEMAAIGIASKRFDIDRHRDSFGRSGMDVVNFRLREPDRHRGLGLQLISRPDIPKRILIEVRAERWDPNPPSHADYADAARRLIGPMLSAYNRANATHYRLRIERTQRDRFKLSDNTRLLLDRFGLLANKTSLHPLDMRRFYELVLRSRQEIPEGELRPLLIGHGFPLATADRLSELYGHLRAFKRLR
jgi:hypothetical protein